MKKYLSLVFALVMVLSVVIVPSSAGAQVSDGCLPGYKYSPITGKPCERSVPPGCLPGYAYDPETGKSCEGTIPPPVISECVVLTKTMQFRKNNTDALTNGEVSKLQAFLQSQGFANAKGVKKGVFDEGTRNMVVAFQREHKLITDGVVGQATRKMVEKVSCGEVIPVTGLISFDGSNGLFLAKSVGLEEVAIYYYPTGTQISEPAYFGSMTLMGTDSPSDVKAGLQTWALSAYKDGVVNENNVILATSIYASGFSGGVKDENHNVIETNKLYYPYTGASEIYDHLYGKVIPPIVGITVTSPVKSSVVSSPLVVSGYVSGGGWGAFEGQVGEVKLIDMNENVLVRSSLTATTDWLKIPAYFSTTLTFDSSKRTSDTGYLVFTNERVKDEDVLREYYVPVKFANTTPTPVLFSLSASGPSILGVGDDGAWGVSAYPSMSDVSYSVNWGDGTTSGPEKNVVAFAHNYKNSGTYTITFKATTTDARTAEKVVYVTVVNELVPTPTNLRASSVTTSTATLSWNSVPTKVNSTDPKSGYYLLRAVKGGSFQQLGSLMPMGYQKTTVTDTGLQPNTTYEYKIVAYTSKAQSYVSDPITAQTAK